MDFQRFHQAIGVNNGNDQPKAEEMDLELTLGLPVNPIYVASQQENPDFNAHHAWGMRPNGTMNGGGNINPVRMHNAARINGIAGYPFMTQHNPNISQEMPGSSNAGGYIMSASSSAAVGVGENILNSDLPPPTMKEYTLLNIPSKRCSTSVRKKSYNNNVNDPNKQCSNYNCRTSCTPMWRKGPLGLNTLCNSCGIKYRKEWKRKQDEQKKLQGRGGAAVDAQYNN